MPGAAYLDKAPQPEVNVLVVSLVLFFAYMIVSAIAAFGLSAAGMALHPATRMFIWGVMTASVGFNLLKRHQVYPTRLRLGLILAFAIMFILLMSISLLLKLGDQAPSTYVIDLVVNCLALFVVGAFGFSFANWVYFRSRRP